MMTTFYDLAVLAQAADGPVRAMGMVVGGWEFVWASWGIAWSGMVLYAVSLFVRRTKG